MKTVFSSTPELFLGIFVVLIIAGIVVAKAISDARNRRRNSTPPANPNQRGRSPLVYPYQTQLAYATILNGGVRPNTMGSAGLNNAGMSAGRVSHGKS